MLRSTIIVTTLMCFPAGCDSDAKEGEPASANAPEPAVKAPDAAEGDAAPETEPEAQAEGKPEAGGHAVDPVAYRARSIWGAVTSGGKPLAGATMSLIESEVLPLQEDGKFVLHMDSESAAMYGDPPFKVTFAAPGHKTKIVDVAEVPDAGFEINAELEPEG